MRNLKKVLSLALALVMLLGMMVIGAGAATDFTDAAQITNLQAAEVADALGIIEGSGGQFMPTTELDRAQAAQIIARMMLGPDVAKTLTATNNKFVDAQGHWAAAAINYCANNGYVEGDGNVHFYPTNKVTGFQFAKMLLGALGYDAEIEGYNGSGWKTNVAIDALQAGLNANGVLISDAVLTRDAAVQMVFNTLTANVVYYPIRSVGYRVNMENKKTNGDYRYSYTNLTGGTSAPTNDSDGIMQFCELHFPALQLVEGDRDGYGDIVAQWKLVKGNTTETISSTGVTYARRYTERVTYAKIYADLGMTGAHVATVYTDGAANAADITVSAYNFAVAGGNGAVTTVWTDNRGDAVRITVKNTYVGDVAGVNTNGTVTVAPRLGLENSTEIIGTAVGTGLAVGDAVTYMRCNGAIINVAKATPVTGTLSAFTQHTATVNGNATLGTDPAVEYGAKLARQASAGSLGQAVTVVKDQYGYILDVSQVTAVPNYAFVLDINNDTFGRHMALVVDKDGQMKTWEITDASHTKLGSSDFFLASYEYVGGKYELAKGSAATTPADYNVAASYTGLKQLTTKGSNVVDVNAGTANKVAVNNTIFFVKTGHNQYTTYQGTANVPSMTLLNGKSVKTAAIVDGSNIIRAVYVDAYMDGATQYVSFSGNASDAIYILRVNGVAGNTSNGVYWSCTAVVNGVLDGNFMAMPIDATKPIAPQTMYTYAVKNPATGVTSIDTSAPAPSVKGSMAVANYAVNLTGTGATGAFVYNDSTTYAYVLSEDGSFGKYDIKLISTDGNDKIWYSAVGSTLALVVVEKVAGSSAKPPVEPGGANIENLIDDNGTYATKANAIKYMVPGTVYRLKANTTLQTALGDVAKLENMLWFPITPKTGSKEIRLEVTCTTTGDTYTETHTPADTNKFAFRVDVYSATVRHSAAAGGTLANVAGAVANKTWPAGDYTWRAVDETGAVLHTGSFTITR